MNEDRFCAIIYQGLANTFGDVQNQKVDMKKLE